MASVLLDSTVLIDLLRGRAGARVRLDRLQRSGDHLWTCAINVDEIARGVRPKERDRAADLIRGLRIAPLGRDEAWRAGDWRRDFAARGINLGQSDCLVAAAAVGIEARLATGNPRDFPMPEITLEHWPAGE
jgi:predicted nucleic acid-binding protein